MKAAVFSLLLAVVSLAEASPFSVLSKAMSLRAPASSETCGNTADLVPLFQMYDTAKTVHYYTADDSQVTATLQEGVYAFTGVAALVFPTAELSTVPFFCLINAKATSYFFTTSETERSNALTAAGYSDCGITGYIYPTQVCGSVPLYRAHFIAANTDYLYTISAADRDNAIENQGFTDEGIAGYVIELASGIIIN
ncbi:hypothetical protein C8F04DRAFT_1393752 [Mycena alexandri]|uniref:DUF5648 domain-containing protein n=1 Tax=Mycena alexandri TaxID=1745969 RepID=A0AAD6T0N7_9AGAR|nr:hypothetical protein C8F04DRAFT_1393752 [Mycena alexandri]